MLFRKAKMADLVALLAFGVALEYLVIAFDVVPRLGRAAHAQGRLLAFASWGAMVFFAGCALTHTGIAVQVLFNAHPGLAGGGTLRHGTPGMTDAVAAGVGASSTMVMLVQHVVPHVAQLIGGALFIGLAKGRLELSIMPKPVAARLRELEMHFRAAFERAPIGIALFSVAGHAFGEALQVNPALSTMIGYDVADLRGRRFEDLVHPADRAVNNAAVRRLLGGQEPTVGVEHRLVHRDGREVWINLEASVVRDEQGAALFSVAQIRDVTEDRRHQRQLRYLADHDPLTGAYNRRRFEEELDRTVTRSQSYGESAALLVADLDQFKYINDTYGHSAGDDMLRAVASAMTGRLRTTDAFGRLGDDEFGLVCPRTSQADAVSLAHALLQAIRAEAHISVSGRVVRTAASIGIKMISGEDSPTGEQLLAQADVAMYEAKESGRARVFLLDAGPLGPASMRSRLAWSERIREALQAGSFQLWEQPILNLATGVCDRSELLVGMIDPRDGSLIGPGQFLGVAERFGQIQAIDRWVFTQAVDLLAVRHAAGDDRTLEVNLSGASLSDENLIDELADHIGTAPFDPTRLIVEVTETAAIVNFELARTVAARLSALGCSFALDDFGSGFGSFYYLKHLPFQGVKIDGEFVKDAPRSTTDRMMLEAIVTIAHGLGKETTAEFVQDDETLTLLRTLSVGFAQGYLIGQPRRVPELGDRAGTAGTADG
jgi:diguanylate cyclase (GGDEF)-like protein/PAS domain S-box-containing protein